MRSKKVIRYYCDHCNKGGFKGPTMLRHEQSCTKNKARICGICAHNDLEQQPLGELMACLNGITNENAKEKLGMLRDSTNGCPACMLTALRHHPKTTMQRDWEEDGDCVRTEFNFKDEMKHFWAETNDRDAQRFAGMI